MWLKEWKKDVKELEAKVREVKSRLRTDWRISYGGLIGAASAEQSELCFLRYDLTHLYQYRAANRGKVHVAELPNYYKKPDTAKYDKLKANSNPIDLNLNTEGSNEQKRQSQKEVTTKMSRTWLQRIFGVAR